MHGIAGPGRYDVEGARVVVDNKTFALTSAGARPWMKAPTKIRLRVRPWGAKAARMVFTVDGRTRAVDRRPPFLFSWGTSRAKPGRHVLRDRRDVRRRPHRGPADPRGRLPAEAEADARGPCRSRCRSRSSARASTDGQEVTGLVVWRVDVRGRAERVEFLVDGVLRGTDVAAPYTFGWNADAEPAGPHVLTARAVGDEDGRGDRHRNERR